MFNSTHVVSQISRLRQHKINSLSGARKVTNGEAPICIQLGVDSYHVARESIAGRPKRILFFVHKLNGKTQLAAVVRGWWMLSR